VLADIRAEGHVTLRTIARFAATGVLVGAPVALRIEQV
jgi:hypothetical protein